MFGLGVTELVIILVIALLIFGPKKIPEVARSMGKSISEFKRASKNVEREVTEAVGLPKHEHVI